MLQCPQVDGSILDGHGRMACVDCARKLSDAALKNEVKIRELLLDSNLDQNKLFSVFCFQST